MRRRPLLAALPLTPGQGVRCELTGDRGISASRGRTGRREETRILDKTSMRFDTEKDFGKIKAKLLYVLSRTDKVFPPSIAPDVMAKLKAAGVAADYFEIDSDYGHSASGLDAENWAPRLRAFMADLGKRS